jgi:hypothetical protein
MIFSVAVVKDLSSAVACALPIFPGQDPSVELQRRVMRTITRGTDRFSTPGPMMPEELLFV